MDEGECEKDGFLFPFFQGLKLPDTPPSWKFFLETLGHLLYLSPDALQLFVVVLNLQDLNFEIECFLPSFLQIGAWFYVDWFKVFGNALTTSCRNLDSYTCMTSSRRTAPGINRGYTLKKTNISSFRCFTGRDRLLAQCKVLGDLVRIFGNLEAISCAVMPRGCQGRKTVDPLVLQRFAFSSADFRHLEYIIRDFREISARILWPI